MTSDDTKHEALQPIHPSMIGKLDPVFEKLYNDNVANTPFRPIDLAKLRLNYSRLYSYGTGPAPEPARVYDTTVPVADDEIPVRVYEPASEGPWPVHIDFHGGGWGLGDLETEAHICKHFAAKANVAVVDVGYRLAPEFPFPTAIIDSWAAVKHIISNAEKFNIKSDSISLGGVSAGGAITLALAHLARDEGIPIKLAAAGTPVIDDISKYSTPSESPWPSMQENEQAPTLNWARLKWFDNVKRTDMKLTDNTAWYADLMLAPNFSGLAKTLIYTAGADPLRDEGEAYARKLVENGVEVTMKRFPGVPHPFMHMDKDLWQARTYIDMMARELRLAHWAS